MHRFKAIRSGGLQTIVRLASTFRTEMEIIVSPWKIDHSSKVSFIGSCFSEHIYSKMHEAKFNVLSNPQGILFNPLSIAKCLQASVSQQIITDDDIFYDSKTQIYHGWDFHSDFSSMDRESMLQHMTTMRQQSLDWLKSSTALFITLGTSKVYYLKDNDAIVANCHKQPGVLFGSNWSQPEQIISSFESTLSLLRSINPDLQVVFTVSPVRHTREGLVNNSMSKALLLTSVHTLVQRYPEYISYFPSYEYVIDELRYACLHSLHSFAIVHP